VTSVLASKLQVGDRLEGHGRISKLTTTSTGALLIDFEDSFSTWRLPNERCQVER